MPRPLEVTLERLFAQAEANGGKAVTWLSHGLCLEAYTHERRTLILRRRTGNPSIQEAHTCAKYAGFSNYGIVVIDTRICVFVWSPHAQATTEPQRPQHPAPSAPQEEPFSHG